MKKVVCMLISLLLMIQCGLFTVSSSSPLKIFTVSSSDSGKYGFIDYSFVDENGNSVGLFDNSYRPHDENCFYTAATSLPSAYDSREKGIVTSVKSQGDSGNCWAFATMSMLETDAIVKNIDSADNADYSEAHFSWFTSKSLTDNTADPTYGDGINLEEPFEAGGNWLIAAGSLARWTGAASEADYPFYPDNLALMGNYGEDKRYDRGSGVVIKSAEELRDIDDAKQWIFDHGSATLAFYYDAPYYNRSTYSYYYNGDNTLNHEITVVGWDDNYSSENFNEAYRPQNNGAWLCKNSWKSDWGDNGYFWISYYDTSIDQFAGISARSAEELYNNYTYNGAGWESYLSHEGNAKISNIFTAKEHELITSVATYTMSPDSALNISVYVNVPSNFSTPESGELAESFSVAVPRAGYHTIDLENQVAIEPDTLFSVVVEYVTDSSIFIPVEVDGQGRYAYSSNSKESYVYLPAYNNRWYDAVQYGLQNVFVQAITKCNHQIKDDSAEATCTDSGRELVYCTQCDKIFKDNIIFASGHKFTQWSEYSHDSKTGKEISTRECEQCGLLETISYVQGKNVIRIDELFEKLFGVFADIFSLIFGKE